MMLSMELGDELKIAIKKGCINAVYALYFPFLIT